MAGAATTAEAQTLPTGASVASGSIVVGQPTAGSLTVTQSTQAGIINWSNFSIGTGASVSFQNGSGATLNRVTGNVPSSINGLLSATGSLYLVNPAGVVVGSDGVVRTGGSFVASTLDIADRTFLAGGSLTFAGFGSGAVVNLGKIGSSHGDVVLIARQVENSGTIAAPRGTAGLASGGEVTIRDQAMADGKIAVRLPAKGGAVTNTGTIRAASVELAANGGNVYALGVNTKSVVKATGVATAGGRVFLTATGGDVVVSQKIVAQRARTASRNPVKDGGQIVVQGGNVTLARGAVLDASGATGGTILVGGDRQGGATAATRLSSAVVTNATTTTVDQGASLVADGTAGDGGSIVVWADQATRFAGTISARGAGTGNGGFTEVSGHTLDYTGTADLRAVGGATGTLLLDPYDLTIDATAAAIIVGNLASANVTLQTTASGTTGPGNANAAGGGDITIASPITWTSANTLTLDAYRSVILQANVTAANGGKVAIVTNDGGTGGDYYFQGGSRLEFSTSGSGSTLSINGTAFTLLYSMSAIQSTVNTAGGLSGKYALAKSLDASSTTGWAAIGTNGSGSLTGSGFTGVFAGLGNTISGLTIDKGYLANNVAAQYVALFGYNSGTIRDLGTIDTTITGGTYVAGLVGRNAASGVVLRSYSTGTVNGVYDMGGLVGANLGTISESYSGANVNAQPSTDYDTSTPARHTYPQFIGGLVGASNGTISNAYSTGAITVTGTGNATSAGNNGSVGGTAIGGLIGSLSGGSVSNAYTTSTVTVSTTPASTYVNAAIGRKFSGTVTDVYYNTDTAGGLGAGGGEVGKTTAELQAGPTGLSSSPWVVLAGAYPDLSFRRLAAPTTTEVTYSITNVSGTYGTLTTLGAVTLTGVAAGDSANVGAVVSVYDASNNLVTLSATTPAGTYTQKVTSLSGTAAASYTIKATGNTTGTLTISPLAIVLGGTKTYDGGTSIAASALSVGNVVGSDVVGLSGTGTLASASAGSRSLTSTAGSLAGLTVSNANYTVVGGSGTVTINPLAVTLTGTRAYDGSTSASGTILSVSNAIGGDSVTVSGTGTLASKDAGSRALTSTAGSLAGLSLSNANYTVVGGSGTVTINPLAVTLTGTRAYDGSTNASGTILSVSNAIGGDSVTVSGTGTLASKDAGSRALTSTAGSLAGLSVSNANYTVVGGSGTVTVNPLAVTLTGTRTYDGSAGASAAILSVSNVVGSDVVGLSGTGTLASANAGSRALTSTAGSLAGLTVSNANYTIVGGSGTVTINPLAVTLTGTRTYDGSTSASAAILSVSNAIGGDSVTVSGTGTLASKDAGSRALTSTAGSLAGLTVSNANYTLAGGSGTVTINPLAVTLTGTRTYDGSTSASGTILSVSNAIGGDSVTVSGTGTLASKDAGSRALTSTAGSLAGLTVSNANYTVVGGSGTVTIAQKSVTLIGLTIVDKTYDGGVAATLAGTATAGGVVGSDNVVVTGPTAVTFDNRNAGTGKTVTLAGYALGGADAGNYTLSAGTLTGAIVPAPLTITAAAAAKTYDGGTSATATPGSSGLQGTDTLTGLTEVYADRNAGSGKTLTIASYTINDGNAGRNYRVTTIDSTLGVIAPAGLGITADAKSKTVGDADPPLTYRISSGALFGLDALAGALTRNAGEAAGTYAITQGTLAASSNYLVSFAGADLTINAVGTSSGPVITVPLPGVTPLPVVVPTPPIGTPSPTPVPTVVSSPPATPVTVPPPTFGSYSVSLQQGQSQPTFIVPFPTFVDGTTAGTVTADTPVDRAGGARLFCASGELCARIPFMNNLQYGSWIHFTQAP